MLALFLFQLLAAPWAGEAFAQWDPVEGPHSLESSGRSLDEVLDALEEEEKGVQRRLILERARQESPFLAVTRNASVLSSLGQGSVDWLLGQDDPGVTGLQPISGREKLLVSFTIPAEDPLKFLEGRSWTYDNAMGAVALLLQGKKAEAKRVLTGLKGLMASNGTLGFSYRVNSSYVDKKVRAGTLAWVGYAFALYQSITKEKTFEGSAKKIAAYLKTLQLSSGSLKGGPDVRWVSTEHNIDAYFFFRELYRVTQTKSYLTTANKIRDSLLKNHWVSGSSGHFRQGIGDSTPALDANSWGAIFLLEIGKKSQASQAMKYVESKFKNSQAIPGSSTEITGYSPDAAKKTIWLEGTLGVAVAYRRLGKTTEANAILDDVVKLQSSWEDQGRWRGALPYAFPRYVNPDGDTLAVWESVASTGWLLIAKAVQDGSRRFWD